MTVVKVETYDNGVWISAADAESISGMSVVEIRQAIKSVNLQHVATVITGKRGRPPKLFVREDLLQLIETTRTANLAAKAAAAVAAPKVASEVAKDLSVEASDEFDTAVA